MPIKYSVCIAAYNAEKYIDECIKSVLNQTFSNYELVIVDDGSSDNTGKIIESYSDNKKIKIYHNETNKGPLFSKIRAINASTGDYLMFMDADDYYELNAIEEVNKLVEEYNADLVMFNYRKVYINKRENKEDSNEIVLYDDSNRNNFLKKVLCKSKYNTIWSKAVRAELVRNNFNITEDDYVQIRRGDDHFISLDIYTKIHNAVETKKILYNYRINEEGLTITQKKKYNFHYKCRERTIEIIKDENCLNENEKKYLYKEAIHKFINQLEEISNFEISDEEKIKVFNKIKESNYYNGFIVNNLYLYKNSIKIKLFTNNKYKPLIKICKLEKIIYTLLGK